MLATVEQVVVTKTKSTLLLRYEPVEVKKRENAKGGWYHSILSYDVSVTFRLTAAAVGT